MVEWNKDIAKLTLPTPFPVGDVHLYLIKGDRLTLVDAGVKTLEAWEVFQEQLAELKLTTADIEQVVLTHHHPDHIGLLEYLPSAIEVHAHPWSERWLNQSDSLFTMKDDFYEELYRQFGVPMTYYHRAVENMQKVIPFIPNASLSGYLAEKDQPLGLEGWQVVETHGHAQGHIALWRESDGLLIGGDVLLAHISPNPFLEPPQPGETVRPKSQLQYNESLKKLLGYPISRVLPGHGEDIFDVSSVIERNLLGQHTRAMKVKQLLDTGAKTVFEICQHLFPHAFKTEVELTLSETAAQLDYLFSLGEIIVEEEESTLFYAVK